MNETIQPLRISFNDTCQALGLSRDGLSKLMKRDAALAACAMKDGTSRQSYVYFHYAKLQAWANAKASSSMED